MKDPLYAYNKFVRGNRVSVTGFVKPVVNAKTGSTSTIVLAQNVLVLEHKPIATQVMEKKMADLETQIRTLKSEISKSDRMTFHERKKLENIVKELQTMHEQDSETIELLETERDQLLEWNTAISQDGAVRA
ncbi:UNVERIFIED_CONTAM: hypothetical protein HDU68_001165 [Siphonaria sp. JEL0065]|nr:hypothetical protein HDU68_001165 [Siphonaria sp. JEL0065]